MKKPTAKQIKAQIVWLEKNKPKIRHYSMFGEDNHANVEAVITVLSESLDENDIYDRFGSDEEEGDDPPELDAALFARRWMDGEEEDTSPQKNWEPLVQK